MSSEVARKDPQRESPKAARAEGRVVLRLARYGRRGEGGPSRYYFHSGEAGGRLYKRDGLYKVDAATAKLLLSTQRFEVVPDHLLEQAKRQAKTPRGATLEQRAAERRRARQSDRHRPHPLEEAERVMATAAPVAAEGDEPVIEV